MSYLARGPGRGIDSKANDTGLRHEVQGNFNLAAEEART